MHCSRCAAEGGIETAASASSVGLASRVAVGTLVCVQCGGPIDDGASGAAIATILARIDRFGLAARSAPLLEPRREDG
jgi:hypothetical protein